MIFNLIKRKYFHSTNNTIIYPVKQCFESRRCMHTGSSFDFSNAYHSYKILTNGNYMSPQITELAMAQKNYVARCLLNDTMLSVLIGESRIHLGYSLHPESFHAIIKDLLYENIVDLDKLMYVDNIDIFFIDYRTISNLGFSENWESRYYDYLEDSLSLSDGSSTHSSNLPMESATTISRSASSGSDTESTIADSDTNTSSTSLDDDSIGNYSQILFFVLCTFIFIKITAWFLREIHKETKQVTSDIPEPNTTTTLSEIQKENLYEEFLEDTVVSNTFSSFIAPLILILIPTCLLFIFYYRYYYFNILKKLFDRK